MGKAEAIVFDIYNTLLDNETDEERQDTYVFLSRWLAYHGVKVAPADLRSRYLNLCRKEMSRNLERYADIEIGNVFSRILEYGGNTPPARAMVSEMALLFRILTTNHLYPFRGVRDVLRALHGRVKLGIASNAQRLFTIPELTQFAMTDYFDAIVFSSDIGAGKPNPKIFLTALEALSVRPEAAVYVGDNLAADIFGAQSVGMKAVWVNRGQLDREVSQIKPDLEARDDASLTEKLLSLV